MWPLDTPASNLHRQWTVIVMDNQGVYKVVRYIAPIRMDNEAEKKEKDQPRDAGPHRLRDIFLSPEP